MSPRDLEEKMVACMLKNIKRWAREFGVKHRGMDLDELAESFKEHKMRLVVIPHEGSYIIAVDDMSGDKPCRIRGGGVHFDISSNGRPKVYYMGQ